MEQSEESEQHNNSLSGSGRGSSDGGARRRARLTIGSHLAGRDHMAALPERGSLRAAGGQLAKFE
jgi:hypothetical protein